MTTTDLTPVQPKPLGEPSGIWSIERVVALATPLFTAAAGYCFTLLAKAIPGVSLNKGQFTALFISGAISALTAALTWLHGRSKFTTITQGAAHLEKAAADAIQHNFPQTVPELRQIEAALEAHEGAIIDGVAARVGAPPSASDVAKQIVTELWPQHPAAQPDSPAPITGGQ